MRYVIVGAGLSGHHAAVELARQAPGTSILLLGAEAGTPYDRPPLSKAVLLEGAESGVPTLSGAGDYAARGIEFRDGVEIVGIDRVARCVRSAGGEEFAYDRLLLATGSRPRELRFFPRRVPGTYLRDREDAVSLADRLGDGGHAVIIGGGFIGLEVAAAARARGCDATVIEQAPRLLTRGMPACVGDWVFGLHRARGVATRLGATLRGIEPVGQGYVVKLDGGNIDADIVVVGIGIVPNVDLAAGAGLDVEDGILVDRHCRTSDPDIFAAGEVTSHPGWNDGRRRRIESWRHSLDQGVAAARNMAGQDFPFNAVPWYWSDQFDKNIQSAGFPAEASRFMLAAGSSDEAWTLVGFGQDGAVVGAVGVDNGRNIAMIRRAMEHGRPLPETLRLTEVGAELMRA